MTNKNYRKGYEKERRLVNKSRDLGFISFRSAGSHSPIDVVVINYIDRKIALVQCKPDSFPESAAKKLIEEHKNLNGVYTVEFYVA